MYRGTQESKMAEPNAAGDFRTSKVQELQSKPPAGGRCLFVRTVLGPTNAILPLRLWVDVDARFRSCTAYCIPPQVARDSLRVLLDGKEPGIEALHAGLECGVIGDKAPGMDIVSCLICPRGRMA